MEKARELAAACDTDAEVAAAVYNYLVEHIRYDRQKAASVQSGYLPDPDETLKTGKGICPVEKRGCTAAGKSEIRGF